MEVYRLERRGERPYYGNEMKFASLLICTLHGEAHSEKWSLDQGAGDVHKGNLTRRTGIDVLIYS